LQPCAVKSNGFYQNAQKLTGNMKNGQILNIVIKYSFLAAGKGTKRHQYWQHFQDCHDEYKFAQKKTLQN